MAGAFTIEPYRSQWHEDWDDFVRWSKNGTFLLCRDFMEYHSDRFNDASLIILGKNKRIKALLPGNISGSTFYSHQGLTYGGIIMSDDMTAEETLEIFELIKDYLSNLGIVDIIYKPIPHIYHRQPAEEDLYALFRNDAQLISRQISTAIFLPDPLPLTLKRRQKLNKACHLELECKETADVAEFMAMVEDNLQKRHSVHSVHSPEEMQRLRYKFPDNIKLLIALDHDRLVAGALSFVTDTVVHTQYLCANDEGRKLSALDFVIDKMKTQYKSDHRWLDLGTSNLDGGRYLNEGLIAQKEGFGGRAIVYDSYRLSI